VNWIHQLDLQLFLLFTLVLTRVSGLVVTAPVLSLSEVPLQVRALFAVALAFLITPTQSAVALQHPATLPNYLVLVGSELVVGLSLGFGVAILFSGIHLAGQLVGRISGLMLADVFDPSTGESIPQFSKLMFLVVTAVFLTIGGHRVVMSGLMDTFESIPPGSAFVPTSLARAVVTLVSESFLLGIRAAAPVVTALLLSTLVMGLISRTLPQLNILAVGFGMNSMLVFGVLGLTLGAAAWLFQDQLESTMQTVLTALQVQFPSEGMTF
jgi:flagellar biosynthetic protein FliR